MKLTEISDHERRTLRNLKALEGRSMTYDELKETLFSVMGTYWAHSDEDYSDEDSEEGYFMIHSLENIECVDPLVLPDGSRTHINGDPAWEIFFVNHDDRNEIDLDDRITVDEVNINVPEHLWQTERQSRT